MRVRVSFAFTVLLAATFLSGCNIVEGWQALNDSRPPEYPDGTDFSDDEQWMATAGKEGRGSQARQTEHDRYWSKLFMTPKARSIENNLGIDHIE